MIEVLAVCEVFHSAEAGSIHEQSMPSTVSRDFSPQAISIKAWHVSVQ
jgi:hypothetical protein